jgi:hypothetical protein
MYTIELKPSSAVIHLNTEVPVNEEEYKSTTCLRFECKFKQYHNLIIDGVVPKFDIHQLEIVCAPPFKLAQPMELKGPYRPITQAVGYGQFQPEDGSRYLRVVLRLPPEEYHNLRECVTRGIGMFFSIELCSEDLEHTWTGYEWKKKKINDVLLVNRFEYAIRIELSPF